jgi:hypothetical protein
MMVSPAQETNRVSVLRVALESSSVAVASAVAGAVLHFQEVWALSLEEVFLASGAFLLVLTLPIAFRLARPPRAAFAFVLVLLVLGAGALGFGLRDTVAPAAAPHEPDIEVLDLRCEFPALPVRGEPFPIGILLEMSAAAEVGFGARLMDVAGDDVATGFGDVARQRVDAGVRQYSREFLIPADAPAGSYEIVAGIWPADQIDAPGVDPLAEQSCGSAVID